MRKIDQGHIQFYYLIVELCAALPPNVVQSLIGDKWHHHNMLSTF
jgi:hypothetical protein